MNTDPYRVRVTGSLVPYVDGFRAELARQGYSSGAAANQLYLMAHLSRWLSGEGLAAGDLTQARVEEFLVVRRAEGRSERLTP